MRWWRRRRRLSAMQQQAVDLYVVLQAERILADAAVTLERHGEISREQLVTLIRGGRP